MPSQLFFKKLYHLFKSFSVNAMRTRIGQIRKNNFYGGFTLIEAMVGVTVIVMAITGPLYVAVHSTGYAKQSRDVIEARYFAEATLEEFRNTRDSFFLHCLYGDATPGPMKCDSSVIQEVSAGIYETTSEVAWRLFSSPLISLRTISEDVYANPTYIAGGDLYTTTPGSSPRKYIKNIKFDAVPSVPFCTPGSYDCVYNIDLRVQVDISYMVDGIFRKVSLVDFIRPRM